MHSKAVVVFVVVLAARMGALAPPPLVPVVSTPVDGAHIAEGHVTSFVQLGLEETQTQQAPRTVFEAGRQGSSAGKLHVSFTTSEFEERMPPIVVASVARASGTPEVSTSAKMIAVNIVEVTSTGFTAHLSGGSGTVNWFAYGFAKEHPEK